ncbi:MAG TPA: hypothetical protein VIJ11_09260 [Galbitalea sp.]
MQEYPKIIESMSRQDHRSISDAAWIGDERAVALLLALGFEEASPSVAAVPAEWGRSK